MVTSGTSNTPLRVTILSDSVMQRASLKELLQQQGSEIVYENSIGGVDPADLSNPADVLLVDLKNAGDASLDKLDDIIDKNELPVLFSDGTDIPSENGPVRNDWANNLTTKLYSLAKKEYLIEKTRPVIKSKPVKKNNSGKKANSASLKKSFPRVAVLSRSNTRRTVLKHILRQQGLKHVEAMEFAKADIDELEQYVHILLIDQHSMGKEEKSKMEQIKRNDRISYLVCNSSKIPLSNEERQILGSKLLRKLTLKASRHSLNRKNADAVALFESNHFIKQTTTATDDKTEQPGDKLNETGPSLFEQDPAHWADKLSDTLAGVRKNIRNININTQAIKDKTTAKPLKTAEPVIKKPKVHQEKSAKPQSASPNVVKLPVSNKNSDKKPDHMETQHQSAVDKPANADKAVNKKYSANKTDNMKPVQFAGILDIFSDMIKAVKEVPAEDDKTASAPVSQQAQNKPGKKQHNEQQANSIEAFAANDAAANEDINTPVDFSMDEDFSFDLEDDDATELAFELELRSLKEELEIFEYDKHSLDLFEQNPVSNKKRSILGINWSNPFK